MTDWERFDFVSLRMAALILGVTPGTVSTAVKRGTLRAKRALMSSGGIMFAISTPFCAGWSISPIGCRTTRRPYVKRRRRKA